MCVIAQLGIQCNITIAFYMLLSQIVFADFVSFFDYFLSPPMPGM